MALAACAAAPATTPPLSVPALLVGAFTDDYGNRYEISRTEWFQHPGARYHIVRWDGPGQFAIARNDSGNPSDGGLWTRIDWLELQGMPPYTWGFCYSAYNAPSAAVAETVSTANRRAPRTGCNGFPFSRMRRSSDGSPEWQEAVPPGRGCWPPRCRADQVPLATPVVAHRGGLVMIGDGADPTHLYESRDGRTWRSRKHDARWAGRYGSADASYRDALWRVGGFVPSGSGRTLLNDVWRSVDGRHWQLVIAHAPWPPRARAHLLVFRDTLWLMGGEPNDRIAWLTTDGISWSPRATPDLPAANPQGVVVHDGRLWILGHGSWDSATNDVWSSPDGVAWHRVANSSPWVPRTGAGFASLNGRLWVVAGATHRDTWSSTDGERWNRGPEIPGPPRGADYSVLFQGGLWVFGGKTGGAGGTGFWDGVWYLR